MDRYNLGYKFPPDHSWTPRPTNVDAMPPYSNAGANTAMRIDPFRSQTLISEGESLTMGYDHADLGSLAAYRNSSYYPTHYGDRVGLSEGLQSGVNAGQSYPIHSRESSAVSSTYLSSQPFRSYERYPPDAVAERTGLAQPMGVGRQQPVYDYNPTRLPVHVDYPRVPAPALTRHWNTSAAGKRAAGSDPKDLRATLEGIAARKRAKPLPGSSPSPSRVAAASPHKPGASAPVVGAGVAAASRSKAGKGKDASSINKGDSNGAKSGATGAEPIETLCGDRRWSKERITALLSDKALANPKQAVIVYLRDPQPRALPITVTRGGPAHAPQFAAELPLVLPDGRPIMAKGWASSKRGAERSACLDALMMLVEAGHDAARRDVMDVPSTSTVTTLAVPKKRKGAGVASTYSGGAAVGDMDASRSVASGGAVGGEATDLPTDDSGAVAGVAQGREDATGAGMAGDGIKPVASAASAPANLDTSDSGRSETGAPLALLEARWGTNPKLLLITSKLYDSTPMKGRAPLPILVEALPGPPHLAGFNAHMPVPLGDDKWGRAEGRGRSKALAERLCALQALEQLYAAGRVAPHTQAPNGPQQLGAAALAAAGSSDGGTSAAGEDGGAAASGDMVQVAAPAVESNKEEGGAAPSGDAVQVVHAPAVELDKEATEQCPEGGVPLPADGNGGEPLDALAHGIPGQVAGETAHGTQERGGTVGSDHGGNSGGGRGFDIAVSGSADSNDSEVEGACDGGTVLELCAEGV